MPFYPFFYWLIEYIAHSICHSRPYLDSKTLHLNLPQQICVSQFGPSQLLPNRKPLSCPTLILASTGYWT